MDSKMKNRLKDFAVGIVATTIILGLMYVLHGDKPAAVPPDKGLEASREDWEDLHRQQDKVWSKTKKALDNPEHPYWHDESSHAPRSPEWPKVRAEHLKKHPVCEACGGTEDLQVHHVEPFHTDPTKELDPTNLITLCESKHRLCHLRLGHAWNFKCYNPNVRQDAARDKAMIEGRKENAPAP